MFKVVDEGEELTVEENDHRDNSLFCLQVNIRIKRQLHCLLCVRKLKKITMIIIKYGWRE